MAKLVKRAYKYRFYPSPEQDAELSRTFGCVRVVWNRALEARTTAWYQRQQRVTYMQSSAMLTRWKRSDGLAYLNEVSSVPLQQALRHLQGAFAACECGCCAPLRTWRRATPRTSGRPGWRPGRAAGRRSR